jgi:large subunit ribosomal protein L27
MAHKKGGGSSRNGRDSNSKRLGVKRFGGEHVIPGNIIVRQRGTRLHSGPGTYLSRDHSIHAEVEGIVDFEFIPGRFQRKRVVVRPFRQLLSDETERTISRPKTLTIFADATEERRILLRVEKFVSDSTEGQMSYYSCYWQTNMGLQKCIKYFTELMQKYPSYYNSTMFSRFEVDEDFSSQPTHGIVLRAKKYDYRKDLTTNISFPEWYSVLRERNDTLFTARFNTPIGDFLFHVSGGKPPLKCKEIVVISHLNLEDILIPLIQKTRLSQYKFISFAWHDQISNALSNYEKPMPLTQLKLMRM